MWTSFFLAILAALAVLYVPGYLIMRTLRLSRTIALICAPIASCALCTFIPIVYQRIGIFCNAATLGTLLIGVTVLIWGINYALCKGSKKLPPHYLEPFQNVSIGKHQIAFLPAILACYIALATVVCIVIFVTNLPTPEAFYSRYDNQTHLNLVQAFLDSGNWSTIATSSFAASPDYATPYASKGGGFYPAAWHVFVAFICSLTQVKVTIASNALIAVLCSVVFPAGMFLLFTALFPRSRRLVTIGALVTSSFATGMTP